MVRNDLFFLGYFIFGIKRLNHPWIVERIKMVEAKHTDTVDLWAREHFKSTIITFLLTIQDILKNPEERIAIFSFQRSIAKGFLRQIKQAFENNDLLKICFDDVLWPNPAKQASKWSEDDGIIVKRKGTHKEATLEAWGLIDGMPTSKHFSIRVYDDLVTEVSVTTPEQVQKVKNAFALSHGLGDTGGQIRIIGTTYHYSDLYSDLVRQEEDYVIRVHPAEVGDKPVLMTREELDKKRRLMGSYIYSAQMLLNPVSPEDQVFKLADMRHYGALPDILFSFILVDPASKKKKYSDFSVFFVVGVDASKNYFILDVIRDKLNLTERWDALSSLVVQYGIKFVGYEEYGMMSDTEYIAEKQLNEGLYFEVLKLAGPLSKHDRITRLVPLFEEHRIFFPERLLYYDRTGKVRDLVGEFINDEYLIFPSPRHDDMLDCLSRIVDGKIQNIIPRAKVKAKQVKRSVFDTDDQQAWGYMAV